MKKIAALHYYQRAVIEYLKEPRPPKPYYFAQNAILENAVILASYKKSSRFYEKKKAITCVSVEMTEPNPESWKELLHRIATAKLTERKNAKKHLDF